MKRAKVLWIALACVLLVLNAAYFLAVVKYKNFRIASSSMEPTLRKNDYVTILRTKNIRRGDLVAYRIGRYNVVKRAIAMDCDTIEIRNKRVFVNGKELAEPYAVYGDPQIYPAQTSLPEPYRSRDQLDALKLPPGTFFVLGDDRDHSNDSRYHGPVRVENVIGRVVLIYSSRGFRRPPASSRTAPALPPK